MALIKCTECGKDVSEKATACPNCGCPIEEIVIKIEENAKLKTECTKLQPNKLNEETTASLEKADSPKERPLQQMLIFPAILIVICVIGFSLINFKNKTQDNETGTVQGTSDIKIETEALSTDAEIEAEIEQERKRRAEENAEKATREAKRVKQIKYEINEQRKQLHRVVDNVENITWLYSKLTPHPNIISGNVLYCYIGDFTDTASLRVVYGFSQDDWVFMDSIIFNIDGSIREFPVDYSDRKTDINDGIAEWVDWYVDDKDIEFLQSIANSKKTLVKFRGDTKQRSFTVTPNQKNAIKQILKYYMLKEKL